MAHETGTASSMADFVSKLFTFLVAETWVQDELVTASGRAAIHKNKIFTSFRWNTTTPLHLAIYQALGYGMGVKSVTIGAAGTGYIVGEKITLSGGTKTSAARFLVSAVGGSGEVTALSVLEAGINYTVFPSTPTATTADASGVGFTANFVTSGSGTLPGEHSDDSGNGAVTDVNTTLQDMRGLYNIGDGPYPSYHFFRGSSPQYFHGVLEYSAGLFRHFGFGTLNQVGNVVGGHYCYGHTHLQSTPTSTRNSCLLDGLWSSSTDLEEHIGATMRIEGADGQPADGKWGAFWASSSDTGFNDDTDGIARARLLGGFRGGPHAAAFGWMESNVGNGFAPMYPIGTWHWDKDASPDTVRLLGYMPDIRGINLGPFQAKQEVTIGGDTWVVFPTVKKQNTGAVDESRNQGIAYKKIP